MECQVKNSLSAFVILSYFDILNGSVHVHVVFDFVSEGNPVIRDKIL